MANTQVFNWKKWKHAFKRDINIFRNPLYIKSCHARLRTADLMTWVIVTLVITSFAYALAYFVTLQRGVGSQQVAAYNTLIPIIFIQSLIILLAGTGSVASGFANEKDTGILNYHRLTPMSPMSKITGYLFGLGIREYLLFGITVPFVLLSMYLGEIPVIKMFHLYGLFFLAALLYHLTGIVAGMIADKARKASVMAQFIVMGLYIMAALRFAGFKAFEYLTIIPAVMGILKDELQAPGSPYHQSQMVKNIVNDWVTGVDFFIFKSLSPTLFTMMLMGFLIVSFLTIIYRKWLNDAAHPISKPHAVIFYAAIIFMIVGSFWPIIGQIQVNSGGSAWDDFNMGVQSIMGNQETPDEAQKTVEQIEQGTSILRGDIRALTGTTPTQRFGFGLLIYQLVCTALIVGIIHVITPERHERIHAIERAKIFKRDWINPFSDAASNMLYGPTFITIYALGYLALIWRAQFAGNVLPPYMGFTNITLWIPVINFALLVLLLQGLREVFGLRIYFMFMFVWWLIPLLLWILLVSAFGENRDVALAAHYVSAPSPVATSIFTPELLFQRTSGNMMQRHSMSLMVTSVILNGILGILMVLAQFRQTAKLRLLYQLQSQRDEDAVKTINA